MWLIRNQAREDQEEQVPVPTAKPYTSSLLLSRLELSDTHVYEPKIRALLGTAAHFCKVVVLKSRTDSTSGLRGPGRASTHPCSETLHLVPRGV